MVIKRESILRSALRFGNPQVKPPTVFQAGDLSKTVPALAITSVRHPAFILTHEADKKGEVQKEAELLGLMETDEALQIPICVVAKERLLTPDEDGDVAEDLMIAVKRAALRKFFGGGLQRERRRGRRVRRGCKGIAECAA